MVSVMNLPPITQSFVAHFGEMGARWGVNRTVGQIYAVLFLSPDPLCADDLVECLGVSRSNVSMGLKELQSWRLVSVVKKPEDRRDYFVTPEDLWRIVRTLAEERKRREIDPTVSRLRELMMETPATDGEKHAQFRIAETLTLIELLTGWYDDVSRLENDRLVMLLNLGAGVTKVLDFKDRVFSGHANRNKGKRDAAGDGDG